MLNKNLIISYGVILLFCFTILLNNFSNLFDSSPSLGLIFLNLRILINKFIKFLGVISRCFSLYNLYKLKALVYILIQWLIYSSCLVKLIFWSSIALKTSLTPNFLSSSSPLSLNPSYFLISGALTCPCFLIICLISRTLCFW